MYSYLMTQNCELSSMIVASCLTKCCDLLSWNYRKIYDKINEGLEDGVGWVLGCLVFSNHYEISPFFTIIKMFAYSLKIIPLFIKNLISYKIMSYYWIYTLWVFPSITSISGHQIDLVLFPCSPTFQCWRHISFIRYTFKIIIQYSFFCCCCMLHFLTSWVHCFKPQDRKSSFTTPPTSRPCAWTRTQYKRTGHWRKYEIMLSRLYFIAI